MFRSSICGPIGSGRPCARATSTRSFVAAVVEGSIEMRDARQAMFGRILANSTEIHQQIAEEVLSSVITALPDEKLTEFALWIVRCWWQHAGCADSVTRYQDLTRRIAEPSRSSVAQRANFQRETWRDVWTSAALTKSPS